MVDLTDTSMAASGTTKKVTVNQILGAGGTATLASATISGDLTVDTSTLKVDSANNRVGINIATPVAGSTLHIVDSDPTILLQGNQLSGTRYNRIKFANQPGTINYEIYGGYYGTGGLYIADYTTSGILFGVSNTSGTFTERYKIDSTGIATWSNVGGVAGTAMTLNSGGLAIGTTTNYGKLSVAGSIASFASNTIGAVSANSGYVVYSAYAGAGAYISFQPTNSSGTQFEAARIDSNGNLILSSSTVPATLASDYQLTLNATSNTNLRFSYRGSDGVTRVANITLA
jgi:hypothetical protein